MHPPSSVERSPIISPEPVQNLMIGPEYGTICNVLQHFKGITCAHNSRGTVSVKEVNHYTILTMAFVYAWQQLLFDGPIFPSFVLLECSMCSTMTQSFLFELNSNRQD